MLHKGEVGRCGDDIAETRVKDVRGVLRGDLLDATSCLLLVKLSESPSKRFVKLVAKPVNRKSRDSKEKAEETQSE